MITEKQFKELGYNIAQIGFYLMKIDQTLFTNIEFHKNIVSLLSQMSLYLSDIMLGKATEQIDKTSYLISTSSSEYLSRKEVIKIYHPLITEYGLNEAIHKNEIPYIKRGKKYFFENEKIKEWINNKQNNNLSTIKYV